MNFKPLRRSSLYHEIVGQIEDMIMSEQLQPGERLPTERSLAEMFDVSRTTVRQALAALEAKGLIQSHIGSGTYARPRSTEFAVARLAHILDSDRVRLTEALEIRSLLEPAVARLAAQRATVTDISAIEFHLVAMEEAAEDEATACDSAFHLAIGQAAQNHIIRTVLDAVNESTRASRSLSLSAPAGWKTSIEDHRAIHAAIAARNGDQAEHAMRTHIQNIRLLATSQLAALPEPRGTILQKGQES